MTLNDKMNDKRMNDKTANPIGRLLVCSESHIEIKRSNDSFCLSCPKDKLNERTHRLEVINKIQMKPLGVAGAFYTLREEALPDGDVERGRWTQLLAADVLMRGPGGTDHQHRRQLHPDGQQRLLCCEACRGQTLAGLEKKNSSN